MKTYNLFRDGKLLVETDKLFELPHESIGDLCYVSDRNDWHLFMHSWDMINTDAVPVELRTLILLMS